MKADKNDSVFLQNLLDFYLSRYRVKKLDNFSIKQSKEIVKLFIKDFRDYKISVDSLAWLCYEIWYKGLGHDDKFSQFGDFLLWLSEIHYWVRNPSQNNTVEEIIQDAYTFLDTDVIR